MKTLLLPVLFLLFSTLAAQKHVYDVELFGKKIGSTTIEKIDRGKGEIQYKLQSTSEVNILFTHKTSQMVFDVLYKDGKLISSYCKNVKDDVTEVVTLTWEGTRYLIKKGEEILQFNQLLDFSAIQLYFIEPIGKTKIFSERLGQFCDFIKKSEGVYECKMANGVINIYRYKNGMLYELEMSKGASVFMKLVR
jgi:hypothetical protein